MRNEWAKWWNTRRERGGKRGREIEDSGVGEPHQQQAGAYPKMKLPMNDMHACRCLMCTWP